MLKLIDKLREASEPKRKRYLVVFVAVMMFFVFFLWLASFNYNISVTPVANEGAKVSDISPFKIFSDKISYIIDSISEELGSVMGPK